MSEKKQHNELSQVFLAICLNACICDHMGDMWNGLFDVAEKLGIELPFDDLECEVDFEALQEMGAVSIRELPDMSEVTDE